MISITYQKVAGITPVLQVGGRSVRRRKPDALRLSRRHNRPAEPDGSRTTR